MPELPDLIYIRSILEQRVVGCRIAGVTVSNPTPLRLFSTDPVETLLTGRVVEKIDRNGPFLHFVMGDDLSIVIHLMLTGRLAFNPIPYLCLSIAFDDQGGLYYGDQRQMGRFYVVPPEEFGAIPLFTEQGIDILSEKFTPGYFMEAAAKSRAQARVFLMNQRLISALGNAYADEVLFAAHIHPKTPMYRLKEEDRRRLYAAVKETIGNAIDYIANAAQPIERKVRDHLLVRNRKGQPCPRCGTTIRRSQVHGYDCFFCPRCQPAPEGQLDWTRFS